MKAALETDLQMDPSAEKLEIKYLHMLDTVIQQDSGFAKLCSSLKGMLNLDSTKKGPICRYFFSNKLFRSFWCKENENRTKIELTVALGGKKTDFQDNFKDFISSVVMY